MLNAGVFIVALLLIFLLYMSRIHTDDWATATLFFVKYEREVLFMYIGTYISVYTIGFSMYHALAARYPIGSPHFDGENILDVDVVNAEQTHTMDAVGTQCSRVV